MIEFDQAPLPEKLPKVSGWQILIRPIRIKTRTAGGIELPAETQEAIGYLRTIGQVVAMGPDCYRHPKFCDGQPWCKVGDWIRHKQHVGERELVRGADGSPIELRYINDDEVRSWDETPDVWVQEF